MKLSVNKKKVGQRIYIIRNKLNLTLEQFGKLSNLNASKSIVLRWENGSSLPNRARLETIAKLGNITVNELLYGSIDEFIKENYTNMILNSSVPYPLSFQYDEIVILLKKWYPIEIKHLTDINNIYSLFDTIIFSYINEKIMKDMEIYTYYFANNKEILTNTYYDYYKRYETPSNDFLKLKYEFKEFLENNNISITEFLEEKGWYYKDKSELIKYTKYYPVIKDIYNKCKQQDINYERKSNSDALFTTSYQNIISDFSEDVFNLLALYTHLSTEKQAQVLKFVEKISDISLDEILKDYENRIDKLI